MMCYSCRKYDNCELPWKCSSTMYDCTAYELEQTNEEWLCGLSTEEKAEWISKATIDAWFRQVNNELPKPNGAKEWAEWLKQPHTEKE